MATMSEDPEALGLDWGDGRNLRTGEMDISLHQTEGS